MTFCTSGCSLKPSGTWVIFSPRRFSSATGSPVSAASVHFLLRNWVQSDEKRLLWLVMTGSTVCLPASMASR